MRTPRAAAAAALLAASLAASPGCFYARRSVNGPERVDAARAARIVPGTTSRAAVLEDLGPPDTVVRHGAPAADQAAGAAALEVFTARGQQVAGRCVYVYSADARTSSEGLLLLMVSQSTTTSTRRLWVLVDDATGLVADCVYREE